MTWKYHGRCKITGGFIVGTEDHQVAIVFAEEEIAPITANPDLLAASRRALSELRDGELTVGLEEDLEAAILKAEGKGF